MGILAGTIAEAEGKESCHFRSEIYSGIANGAVGFFSRTVPARFRWDMVGNMAEKSREFRHGILLPFILRNSPEPTVFLPDCSTWDG